MGKSILLSCAALLACVTLLSGCGTPPITGDSVRANMSPELESIAASSQQRKTMHARTVDTNLRQIWDDLDAFLLLDQPVRLSRYYIP